MMTSATCKRLLAGSLGGAAAIVLLSDCVLGQSLNRQYLGTQLAEGFGLYMDDAPDIDGDGVADLVVGAPRYSTSLFEAGRVYVFASTSTQPLRTHEGTATNLRLGSGIGGLGDVDGDGRGDYGATAFYPGTFSEAWVWSGVDGTLLFQDPTFGFSMARAGDLNADGFAEVLVGDPRGEARVYAFDGTSFSQLQVQTNFQVPFFGQEVAGLGDVDGDGVGDYAVGAPSVMPSCPEGLVGVYSGSGGALLYTLRGNGAGDAFGFSIAGVGDVSGNGLADLAVGAYFCCVTNCTLIGRGQARIFEGSTGKELQEVQGEPPQCSLGYEVEGPGDVDGDSVADILVYFAESRAHVDLFSGSDLDRIYRVYNPFPQGWKLSFGVQVRGVGDFNGDDFPDYLISDYDLGTGSLGRVVLFSGAPQGLTTLGTACPSAGGQLPRIAASSVPLIGTTISVNLSQVPAGASAFLFLGVSNTSWGGLPLPLDLASFGMPGCELLVSVEASVAASTVAVGAAGGVAKVPLSIPNNAALIGLSLYAQWLVANPLGTPSPAFTTRGLQVTFR